LPVAAVAGSLVAPKERVAMTAQSVVVQEQPGGAQQLFLLLHGYGANAEDLVPIGRQLAKVFPNATIVSVAAPEPMGYPGGLQWFSLDGINDLNRVTRVADALPGFLQVIRDWRQRARVSEAMTALVGFSQGSTMALEASVGEHAPAARVVAIAGRFARLPTRVSPDVTIHLLHGKEDAVVPCRHTVEGANRLRELGGDVTADVYPGIGHEIRNETVQLVVQRLTRHVPKRLWEEAMKVSDEGGNDG
jgi:phospholipase/carboxylesterase